METKPTVGMVVGAHRWPQDGSQPHMGVVIDEYSTEAWEGMITFGAGRELTEEAVREHVEWIRRALPDRTSVPVKWSFGKVCWEDFRRLRPYSEDYAAWLQEREIERMMRWGE